MNTFHHMDGDFDHAVIVIHSENYIDPPTPQAHIAQLVVDDVDDSNREIIMTNEMTSEEPEVTDDKV